MTPASGQISALVRGLMIGTLAGALCAWLKTPLPWLIGPLVACAAASASGVRLHSLPVLRATGQWAIGTALGLYFTPAVLARVVQLWPALLAGVAWALAVGLSCAWALRRFAGADPATAFFAGAVGGASEMALQGERHGGAVETIAAAHSLRIMLVVIILPFAYRGLDLHGPEIWRPGLHASDALRLAGLVLATCAGALLLRATRSPNVWVIGPLLAAGLLTAFGLGPSALPAWAVNGGQVFIGVALGTRFRPGFFSRAPRLMTVVAGSTLASIVASALFAAALGTLAGIPVATMVLATSPGGIAEMSLTAKVLGLGVPIVTVFHVTRMIALVLLAGSLYRTLAARFGWPVAEAGGRATSPRS